MNLKASYRRTPNERWVGVLKDAKGKIVWECGHSHECRDYNHSWVYQHTGAAMYCARKELERRQVQPICEAVS
ncbi:MAG: hypothetical protein AB7R40_23770 [Nitrospiraceae bacterium]